MILFKKVIDLRNYLDSQQKDAGLKDQKSNHIGFVPTMGALHAGHLSLVELSKKENSLTVCSIFINPTQFNDPGDFKKYPVTLEKDVYLLESAGCDILFLPSISEVYPEGPTSGTRYELGYLETVLEGKFRPGHFQGVSKVVNRFLEIVKPGRLYMGQKDYQQCKVIEKLVQLMGMSEKLSLVICPTLREPDGLAMSSRNMRLNENERKKAASIYKSLDTMKDDLTRYDPVRLKKNALQSLEKKGFKVDYVEIADAATLQPVDKWNGEQKLVGLVAAFINEVRLIDNMILN